MAYDLYPAVDPQYNFPPEIRQALAISMELRNTIVPMTTATRNNLLPGELWDGRVIANTTTDHLERYDSGTAQWVEQVAKPDLTASISAATTPTGGIISFAGATAPSGWLICDGAAISRTTYPALFTVCGTTYGVGNGTTTFNIPNLKGRVPAGLDASQPEFTPRGAALGSKTHTLTTAQMPSHSHSVEMAAGTGASRQDGATMGGATNRFALAEGPAYMYAMPQGGGASHPILQPYLVLNHIIKT